jgi:membrane-bound lytic murein transglycosylase A
MIAQDTGSAIVGPARADLYFGAGVDAGKVAGRLRNNMRFVILVPKSLDPSVRGRKMPVPDARPSEKIAKLFPQVDPPKDQKTGIKSPEAATTAQAAVVKPVPLPAVRPNIKPVSEAPRHRHFRRFRYRP